MICNVVGMIMSGFLAEIVDVKGTGIEADWVLKHLEFEIKGILDSNYAKEASACSMSGYTIFLNDAPMSMKLKEQLTVLSMCKAESFNSCKNSCFTAI